MLERGKFLNEYMAAGAGPGRWFLSRTMTLGLGTESSMETDQARKEEVWEGQTDSPAVSAHGPLVGLLPSLIPSHPSR